MKTITLNFEYAYRKSLESYRPDMERVGEYVEGIWLINEKRFIEFSYANREILSKMGITVKRNKHDLGSSTYYWVEITFVDRSIFPLHILWREADDFSSGFSKKRHRQLSFYENGLLKKGLKTYGWPDENIKTFKDTLFEKYP